MADLAISHALGATRSQRPQSTWNPLAASCAGLAVTTQHEDAISNTPTAMSLAAAILLVVHDPNRRDDQPKAEDQIEVGDALHTPS